ncbi:uncharacterized protein [Watersipora subatra]|uniref:uncharacterized protein n=1 Tax=Watersipora subatra TaxID=2589382 RepID=UPI00355B66F5
MTHLAPLGGSLCPGSGANLTNALDQPADIVIVPRHDSERSHYSLMLVDRKLRKIHLMDSLSYKGQQTIEKRKLVSVDERFADYAVTDGEMAAMQQKDCVSCGLYVIKVKLWAVCYQACATIC